MNANNPYRNVRIEFHILQSFPVSCLNRDDVGAPKTAMIGGTLRARVSSQCWKRSIRLTMKELGISIGDRTKLINKLISDECKALGATDEQAEKCGREVAAVFIKEKSDSKQKKGKKEEIDEDDNVGSSEESSGKSDALLFISKDEVRTISQALKDNGFNTEFSEDKVDSKGKAKTSKIDIKKKIESLIGKPKFSLDGLDIALFGRMVAQAANLNVEAASSFSHAISTHKVTNEVEFFTALDDCNTEQGSAHMGSLEFNSATYYRYICLDMGQLWENLGGQSISEAVEAFVKSIYLAVPSARQTTQAGYCPWEFAKIFVRKGQRLQMPFTTAVKLKNNGFIDSSKEALCEYLSKKEKLAGSLFGKIKDFTFGEDENFNIDKLIESIQTIIKK
ncbi:MAG: type I-E CRISPR-associated protein Cas7/Cse4/CasC [Desulfamplus sp.]|nr:type I-E CRISPR-associated protein Cas7/Cse4/CasC [Desulfamplus sp.]